MKRDTLTTLALIVGTVMLTYACAEVDDSDGSGDTGAVATDTGTPGTGEIDHDACSDAVDRAYQDCAASLTECACDTKGHWNVDDYEPDGYLLWCYLNAYWACYDTNCVTGCYEGEPGSCCEDVMALTEELMPDRQPGW